jgi:anthranilate synthase component 1
LRTGGRFIPTREEFRRLAVPGSIVPVYVEHLDDAETPVMAFAKLAGAEKETPGDLSHRRFRFLLESTGSTDRGARYSFLGTRSKVAVTSKGRQVQLLRLSGDEWVERRFALPEGEDPLDLVKSFVTGKQYTKVPGLGPFCGGAVGYLSYDIVRFFEEIPEYAEADLALADCCFVVADSVVVFDHVRRTMKIVSNASVDDDPDRAYAQAVEEIEEIEDTLRRASARLATDVTPLRNHKSLDFRPNMSASHFENAVIRTKSYIEAGDIIQAVISQRLSSPVRGQPFDSYRVLRSLNPSPYMYYIDFDETQLAGASPEVLVTVRDRVVTTRPIAGTRPRGETEDQDRALEGDLLADEKERAEHVMLVDLARNDLGRVSEYGTVKVPRLMEVERFSHVMHIVTDVVGRLREECDQFDVLRATFPAGTVSGAPKIRAMEIIDELEPTQRGPYAGCVGYFDYSGGMDMCITIRTIVFRDNVAHIQAGAGIVADSVPEREYEETLNKARACIEAVSAAEVLEAGG